jgi:hypothetical protein
LWIKASFFVDGSDIMNTGAVRRVCQMLNKSNGDFEEYNSTQLKQLLDSVQLKIQKMFRAGQGMNQIVLMEGEEEIVLKMQQRLTLEEKLTISKELQGSLVQEGNQAVQEMLKIANREYEEDHREDLNIG